MPTIRCQYSFEQFRITLQGLAYKIALEAMQTMDKGRVTIKVLGSRPPNTTPFESALMESVDTDEYGIKFYARHAYYQVKNRDFSWSFDVEDKQYMDSGHQTKITFSCLTSEIPKVKKTILAFVDKLFQGQEPTPRFKLAQTNQHS